MDKELSHYGTPRHSGRYKWGSGEDPQQRGKSFLGRVEELEAKGLKGTELAKAMGMTTTQLRAKKSLAKDEIWKEKHTQAVKLKEKGMSNVAISERMGLSGESAVRALLKPSEKQLADATQATTNMLKDNVAKKEYLDIGVGVERHLNVSRTKLKTAISQLQEEGYMVTYVPVEQLGTGKKTSVMVLSKPKNPHASEIIRLQKEGHDDSVIAKKMGINKEDVTAIAKEAYADVYSKQGNIKQITDYSEDGGRSYLGLEPINSIDSKRIMVRHHEEGGTEKDGLIELRRGVSDISLGGATYAQVRMGVDGTHYMKGMAVYNDNMPKGVDVIYNVNKKIGAGKDKIFKPMKEIPEYTQAVALKDKEGLSTKEIAKKMNMSESKVKSLFDMSPTERVDKDNPFGATVKQKHYVTDKGAKTKGSNEMLGLKMSGHSYEEIAKMMKVSESLVKECIGVKAVNIVNEEGEWRDKWSKSLSSQMLSKQSRSLAKRQLELAYNVKKEEYDEIMSLNNPVVRKRLLASFADDCDSSAVHLKAAALPRAGWHALIPFPTMKENEVYAPNFRDGERVVLIRYPHGGTFEIPELVVNNRHKPAREVLGDHPKDAIGIHSKVAEKLSGADFDGDSVMVIPNNNKEIKVSDSLKGLKDFDPKALYPLPEDAPRMSPRTKGLEMGNISNLITDMTIKGAKDYEIAAAVRHSMVVIDAEKHHLDYKQSARDNGIAALKQRYQGSAKSGASTLISRASSEKRVDDRKEKTNIKKMTPAEKKAYLSGHKVYEYTGETYTKREKRKDGTIKETIVKRTNKSTKMAEESDAYKLSSGTPMENVYADHANKLKALANESRKEFIKTPPLEQNKAAKEKYKNEVNTLNAHLNVALKNAPLERQALILANSIVAAKKAAKPNMDADELKKLKGQALNEARLRTGAKKQRIEITDKEWEAIQAGAISNNKLSQILNNTDLDRIKALATPRSEITIAPAKKAQAERYLSNGYTRAEVADALGISVSTLSKVIH